MLREIDVELCGAAERGDVGGIERLIAGGADLNASVDILFGDKTPLLCAAGHGRVAAIAALVKAGAHVDGVDSSVNSPLMIATMCGHMTAVDALIAAGADVHRTMHDGRTALHYASQYGYQRVLVALLAAGARTDLCTAEGKRPIDLVRNRRDRDHSCERGKSRRGVRCCVFGAQVCRWPRDSSDAAGLRALLLAAEPWARRRTAALACFGGVWVEYR